MKILRNTIKRVKRKIYPSNDGRGEGNGRFSHPDHFPSQFGPLRTSAPIYLYLTALDYSILSSQTSIRVSKVFETSLYLGK